MPALLVKGMMGELSFYSTLDSFDCLLNQIKDTIRIIKFFFRQPQTDKQSNTLLHLYVVLNFILILWYFPPFFLFGYWNWLVNPLISHSLNPSASYDFY